MSDSLKQAVKAYWEAEPCGSRGHDSTDDAAFFRDTEAARYQLDGSLIFGFAEFPRWRGKRVLEIGVGTGTDFLQWARSGAEAVGVDLTERAVLLTRRRLAREGLDRPVYVADAEQLPFADGSFDLVYSWGVLHHSPNTEKTRRRAAPRPRARRRGPDLSSTTAAPGSRSWPVLRHGPLAGHPFASATAVLSAHVESTGDEGLHGRGGPPPLRPLRERPGDPAAHAVRHLRLPAARRPWEKTDEAASAGRH